MQLPVVAISHIIKTELTINTTKSLNTDCIYKAQILLSVRLSPLSIKEFLKIWPCLGFRESSWVFCSSSMLKSLF